MRKKPLLFLLLVPILSIMSHGTALAFSSYVTAFSSTYLAPYQAAHPGQALTIANCALCHVNPGGGGTLTSYGNAFANGHSFTTIEGLDSDGDTFANLTEIMALPQTYPGNAASFPAPAADTTKPVVTTFTIPATATTLVVPITALTATDNVKVTRYKVTSSATAPLPSAAGWTSVKPVNLSFPSAGTKTLHAWAKDAAGNVSLSLSASVTITLSDAIRPRVTAFTIPAAVTTLVVPITTFTATDNVGVTGYMVTPTAKAPLAGAKGWSATAPKNYSFLATSGAKTLHAWVKDGAGRVSLAMSAPVTLNVTDLVKPVVSAFTLAPAATANTATITTLTATDNVAVTRYKLTSSAKAPLAGAMGWKASKPVSFTFPTAGTKKLYAWAKDAAGNVSLSRVASVTVAAAPVAFAAPAQLSALSLKAATDAALIPVPVNGQQLKLAQAVIETPSINADPALAMPVGVGAVATTGGSTVTLQAALGQFAGPVDVYLTLHVPAGLPGGQIYQANSFNATANTFEPIAGAVKPWQSGVFTLNETIWNNLPVTEFSPGTYMVTLEVTPAGQLDGSYSWTTYFNIQ